MKKKTWKKIKMRSTVRIHPRRNNDDSTKAATEPVNVSKRIGDDSTSKKTASTESVDPWKEIMTDDEKKKLQTIHKQITKQSLKLDIDAYIKYLEDIEIRTYSPTILREVLNYVGIFSKMLSKILEQEIKSSFLSKNKAIVIRLYEALLALSMRILKSHEKYRTVDREWIKWWDSILPRLMDLYDSCIEKRTIYEMWLRMVELQVGIKPSVRLNKIAALKTLIGDCILIQNEAYINATRSLNKHRGLGQRMMNLFKNSDSKHNWYLAIVRKLVRDSIMDKNPKITDINEFRTAMTNKSYSFAHIKEDDDNGKLRVGLMIPSSTKSSKWQDLLNFYSTMYDTESMTIE